MMDKEKLDLINSMDIIDYSTNGVEIEYILVGDNEVNRNILHKIGLADKDIECDCYPDDGTLDITAVGFKYADYFCGRDKKFLLTDNDKEIFVDMVMDLLIIIDLDGVSQDARKEDRMRSELLNMKGKELGDKYDQAYKLVEKQRESEVMSKIL